MIWTNSGTLRKSAGAGITHINNFDFINQPSGIVQTLSGTLQFNGGPGNVLGGSLVVTSPGLMNIAGGTWTDAGGSASGTGTNRFNAGTLNLRTNIISGLLLTGGDVYVTGTTTFQQAGAITNLTLDGSTLRGTNRVGTGALTVNSGGIGGFGSVDVGRLTVQAGGQLLLTSPGLKTLYSLNLINQGTINWSAGQLNGGNTPTTVISNGGLWEIFGDNSFVQGIGGPFMIWTNSGTLRKSAGAGITHINNFDLINQPSGIVQTLSGTLQFNGGPGNILGGSLVANSALMNIAGGIWTDAGGTASGTGTNRFNAGTLNLRTNIIPGLLLAGGDVYVTGTNTFQQAGAITNLTLDGSTLRGTNRVGTGALTVNSGGVGGIGGADAGRLTVQAGGQLLLASSGLKTLYSLNLINQGTVNWSAGQLNAGNTPTTVISNGNLWQITADNSFVQGIGGPVMIWINSGTLRKSAGAGSSFINTFNLVNQSSGLIQVDTGTLQLPSSFTNTAGTLRLNGGTLQASGTLDMTGGTLDGAGTLGANALTGGTVSPGLSPGLIGFKSGLTFGPGATLTMEGTGTVPGTQYDQLSVTGAVTLAGCTLQVPSLPSVAPGTTFTLVLNDGADAVSGTFAGLAENALLTVSGQPFRIHYAGGTGNDVTLVRDNAGPPISPTLSSGGYSNGTFRVLGVGGSGVIYTIQASTNFFQWTNLGLATGNVGGNLSFIDTNAALFRYRFYRTTNQ